MDMFAREKITAELVKMKQEKERDTSTQNTVILAGCTYVARSFRQWCYRVLPNSLTSETIPHDAPSTLSHPKPSPLLVLLALLPTLVALFLQSLFPPSHSLLPSNHLLYPPICYPSCQSPFPSLPHSTFLPNLCFFRICSPSLKICSASLQSFLPSPNLLFLPPDPSCQLALFPLELSVLPFCLSKKYFPLSPNSHFPLSQTHLCPFNSCSFHMICSSQIQPPLVCMSVKICLLSRNSAPLPFLQSSILHNERRFRSHL